MRSSSKNIYFISDLHLGLVSERGNHSRERLICEWLRRISEDASEVFLLGDVFDFWHEYRYAVPKGSVRLLGTLAEMSDKGIQIYFFKGNHDMWMRDYLTHEIGATIVSDEFIMERGGKTFFLHHGDGLGKGEIMYKLVRKIFRNSLCQWLYKWIHPDVGIPLARYFSHTSRQQHHKKKNHQQNDPNSSLIAFSNEMAQEKGYHYFIYGHRHSPIRMMIHKDSCFVNLGDWITHNTYAVFDGKDLTLHTCILNNIA
jgi:UDP-2,3-diacylglucosamine hydrolase